ncbi:MAG TPA: hypothetical protein VE398_10495 [Acidobacteriota bacterium]|nr:hypothetical protein [Acidobacteriota bacterium]
MKSPARKDESGQPPEIAEIAKLVLVISGVAILGISLVSLGGAAWSGSAQFAETSRLVFNALLPLLGTWVGTVLAYYFSRKNFESASQSVERMVTLTVEQKLGQMFVEKEMMRPGQITLYQIPAGKTPKDVLLKDLRSKLGGKITRIPIVDSSGAILYIVHQSGLFKFFAEKALEGKAADIDKLTLQDLVDDAELKNWVANIVYVSEQASVGDAKNKMEQQTGCQDLIVTKTGNKTEPMLGWMTNVDIGRLSKA